MHPSLSREELTKLFRGDVPWREVDAILADCSEERSIEDVRAELSALAVSRLHPDEIAIPWPRPWTPERLIAFEKDIADTFNAGKIKAPVHLAGGNEQQLIDIFKDIRPQDWVCGGWRMHYHALLKRVPPQELKDAIVAGRSIGLCFPAQRVISSALVGGIVPIALGLAWAAKRRQEDEKVWCFIGDMTYYCGLVQECAGYAFAHKLPLRIVVEDNGKSVATDTKKAWGMEACETPSVIRYAYTLSWPHVGTGTWVHM
jgi:Dehydrogenase E1 component